MRIRHTFLAVAVALCIGWSANEVFSQDQGGEDAAGGPDQAEMMRKWMEYMTPGEPHSAMSAHTGTWSGETKMYEGGSESSSTTTYQREMILGGRYLVEDVSGSWSGMPFEGRAIAGYDNHRKEYFSIWVDSFGTGLMVFRGKKADDGSIRMATEPQEDFSGRVSSYRTVTSYPDADTEVFEMFHIDAEGKESLAMKTTLARGAADQGGEATEDK